MPIDIKAGLGSGGSIGINEVAPLNVNGVQQYINGIEVYLRSGIVDTDLVSYPDATKTITSGSYSGTSFDISVATGSNTTGITWDGSNFWVISDANNNVVEYDSTFTATGNVIDVSSETTSPTGIAWDGSNFWVSDNVSTVYQYNTSYNYTGTSFSTAAKETAIKGLTSDGEFIYVSGLSSDSVHEYDLTGTYTGFTFATGPTEQGPEGLTTENGFVWVAGNTTKSLRKYDYSGSYTNISIDVSTELAGTIPTGVAHDGTRFIVCASNGIMYQYDYVEVVGLVDAAVDTDTGLPIYTRVK